jgi:PBP1b-binding outer membrane lipoprotein LpoB
MKIYFVPVLLAAFLFVGCSSEKPAADSPSAALKQYFAASQREDIAAMKALLSKGSLELIEKSARLQNASGDDLLRRESKVKIQKAPELRNEKIEGDAATVEVKNETTGEFDMVMPFVREDGAWKLARDKYIADLMKKASDEINQKLANSAVSSNSAANLNSNSASNTNSSVNR